MEAVDHRKPVAERRGLIIIIISRTKFAVLVLKVDDYSEPLVSHILVICLCDGNNYYLCGIYQLRHYCKSIECLSYIPETKLVCLKY